MLIVSGGRGRSGLGILEDILQIQVRLRGVGLQVGAWGASDPWATVAVVRRQLLDPVHEALRPLSEKKPVVSNRKGKSGLIVRAVADDWGVQAGVDSCLSALRAIESVLAGVGH